MAALSRILAGPAAPAFLARRPEAAAYALSAACWGALLLLAPAGPGAPWFCTVAPGAFAGLSFIARAALADFQWPLALWHWLLMIGAMMVPVAAPALRHVAFRSFRARRARAMTIFLLGYGAVWMAAAPLFLLAGLGAHLAGGGSVLLPFGLALGLAALWQGSAGKRSALRLCHRTVPLPPSGARADRACFVFGLAHGRSCLASCWAMMLLPVFSGHQAAPMLLASLVGIAERAVPATRPDRTAGPLALAACLCLALWAGTAF